MTYSDFRDKYKTKIPNIIKIDTQGSELDIVKAFNQDDISQTYAIAIRVCFDEINEGQPLFTDIDRYMTGIGFNLQDLKLSKTNIFKDGIPYYYLKKYGSNKNPNITQKIHGGFALYFKNEQAQYGTSEILMVKQFITLILYKCFDEAIIILESEEFSKIFNKEDLKSVKLWVNSIIPRYSFLAKISKKLGRIASYFSQEPIAEPAAPWW